MAHTYQTTEYLVDSLEELEGVAQQLAAQFQPGDVVVLTGPMGAGKTTLMQAVARQLRVKERVTSPTFSLMHEYPSGLLLNGQPLPIIHVDLYRLDEEGAEAFWLELDEYVTARQHLFWVEWPERLPYLGNVATHSIQLAYQGESLTSRVISLQAVAQKP